ncbi:tRNA (adenosine(37)-N6)-threonylcarbamoyltransferase complex ATPase subunit type 1 TsaE [Ochrobactrum sp. SFR4]|uniref:tRNA (adenosine(37)-N6)-threonylcarbamoyltransferase complex ATPase subunit type 1 TsaE n=1 Tax=Ochrobactrum sp. SFR4 TaxID=2717368 RepID=UPI001C8C6D96|nr:tRNA (adenosine(37)-N6)-threonylcarbamoyltransferase complex ATPase subunit type 1 TsaE [Ochrobactrum sp. SFR4]MBX8825673.1 tRNA (adenosine(37)-N6)-threonylcarbamoyltransferase complex ATPase subunit type 1 TsaE [Ochrobactrum sp. SFR4]
MADEQDSSTLYTLELVLENEAAMVRFAEDIALALTKGDLVTLKGDLGAGKSTLARAIIRTIANDDFYEVPSPTFTLVQSYPELRLPIAHTDLYRLSSPEELDELGLDEALESGAVLVEWPQQGEGVLPAPTIAISIDHEGDGRRLTMEVTAKAARRISRSLGIRSFLGKSGRHHASRRYLLGDASPRGYELITSDSGTEILMNAPAMPYDPPVKDGRPYRQIAHLAENMDAFVAMSRLLSEKGFRVPEMRAINLDRGFLLMEHLGTEGVLDSEGKPLAERYVAAARMLAHLHQHDWPQDITINEDRTHHLHVFDRDAMLIEAELLPVWYLPYCQGEPASADQVQSFEQAWDSVFKNLEHAEYNLLMRDYHSPNILWQEKDEGIDRLGIIDFQDAMIGPSAYDLASLAMDARVTIADDLQDQIVAAYCDERRKLAKAFDQEVFRSAYAIMAAQRNTKILGIFVRLFKRDGKPAYLQHLPRIQAYAARALQHPSLAPVRKWYQDNGLLQD